MAAYHARSNSLPSRSHPFVQQINEQLCRIKSSEGASTSTSSVCCKLSILQDLHDCVEELLLLPLIQQTLTQEQSEGLDELLDGSLRLLDACSSAKDVLLQTKECTRELQSSMRRRCGDETDIKKYLASRKIVKKAIQKALGNLKGVEKKCSISPINKDHEALAVVSMLREVEAVTAAALKSLLSLISGSNLQKKKSGWSLVSKVMHHRRVASEEVLGNDKFMQADGALESLYGHKESRRDKHMFLENVQNQLKDLEQYIQELEDGLECLYRRLIKTRVSFLNIFNH